MTVTDSAGAPVTGTFSLTVTPASPQPGRRLPDRSKLKEALTGQAINGQTPTGTALANETQFSGCGGFSILSISVKKVNLPNGTQLCATIDMFPVGIARQPPIHAGVVMYAPKPTVWWHLLTQYPLHYWGSGRIGTRWSVPGAIEARTGSKAPRTGWTWRAGDEVVVSNSRS